MLSIAKYQMNNTITYSCQLYSMLQCFASSRQLLQLKWIVLSFKI